MKSIDTVHYLLSRKEISEIVEMTIREASASWGWGDSMDMPVLWLQIERVLEGKEAIL